ncbi:MAG: hypothetical protein Q8N63_09055 [Nanoarchaeota archaeon]|nr:hypothetical protein [Nanoarchaeota archaeon]
MPAKEETISSSKEENVKNAKRSLAIQKEAKQILDKFAKELSKTKEIPDSFVEREEDRRKESEKGQEPDSDFRKIFFENAPATKKDSIQAEKGGWK